MISIIDRKEELKLLERIWENRKNSFVVVYGRRRIGKTTLLKEFVKNKDGLFYIAEDTIKNNQIDEFKNSLGAYLNDDFMLNNRFENWSSLFSYLSKIIDKEKKFYIWIDEFSYLIKNDKSIISSLQKFIDHTLRESNIHLLVSGSLFGIMIEEILSHSSPLYGRRTSEILLEEIPTKYNFKFLNKYNFEDALKVIMITGGIPEYLDIASSYNNYKDFINFEFLNKRGYFYRELFFLLSSEFKEIRTYFSILNAISYGNVKPSKIANFIGMEARKIYPYLELIINYGFIKKEVSFNKPKEGIYLIKDSFIDFWFNFTFKNRTLIENGNYKLSNKELSTFFGKRFEELIRNNIYLFINNKFNNISSWWYKEIEIDICGINEEKNKILFGECKWQENVDASKILRELNEKSQYVKWNNENRKEEFVIFAKSFKEFKYKRVENGDRRLENGERRIVNREIWEKENNCKLYDLKDLERVFMK